MVISSCLLLIGTIFGAIAGFVNDRNQYFGVKLLKMTLVYAVAILWILYGLIFYLPEKNEVILAIAVGLGGVCFMVIPLCFDLSVECTYPVGQGLVNGFLSLCFCFTQFVLGIVTFKFLPTDFDDSTILENNSCNIGDPVSQKPKDFSRPLLILFVFFSVFVIYPIKFMRIPFYRKNKDENRDEIEVMEMESAENSHLKEYIS